MEIRSFVSGSSAEYSRGFQLAARVVYTERARRKTATQHKWCRAVYVVLHKPHSQHLQGTQSPVKLQQAQNKLTKQNT